MFPTQFALCVMIDHQRLPQPLGKTNQNGLFDITYIYIMITKCFLSSITAKTFTGLIYE